MTQAYHEPGERRREPMFNLPPAVAGIAGILIAIHVVRILILPDDVSWALVQDFGFVPAQVFSAPEGTGDGLVAWGLRLAPFVTYSLLHGDFIHLGFNTIWLVALGSPVERYLGAARFCAFTLIGAILAAAFYGLIHRDSGIPMIGASGAVSALMGALIRFLFAARSKGGPRRLVDPGLIAFSAIWIALNIVMGVAGLDGVTTEARSIAWEAHVGGFLAGLLIAPLFANHSDGDDLSRRLRGMNGDG